MDKETWTVDLGDGNPCTFDDEYEARQYAEQCAEEQARNSGVNPQCLDWSDETPDGARTYCPPNCDGAYWPWIYRSK